MRILLKVAACLVVLMFAAGASAYDFPLSPTAIRDAYFTGTRLSTSIGEFLASYTHIIPELKFGTFTSSARIETPFTQVVQYASRTLGYSAQDAVKDFYDNPGKFRIDLNILYKTDAPPNAVKIKIVQNKKELAPDSFTSNPYYPSGDKHTRMPSIGEQIHMEFNPEQIDSSMLTILIDTPDNQHAEAQFDLQTLR